MYDDECNLLLRNDMNNVTKDSFTLRRQRKNISQFFPSFSVVMVWVQYPFMTETAMETIVISMEKMGIMGSGDGVHTVCDSKSKSKSNGKEDVYNPFYRCCHHSLSQTLKERSHVTKFSQFFILKYRPVFQFSIVSMAMGWITGKWVQHPLLTE